MRPHLHISAVDFLVVMLMYVIIAFVMRTITVQWPDSSIARAIVYIHG